MITLDISAGVNGKAGLGRYALSLAAALDSLQPGQVQLFANVAPGGSFPASLEHLRRHALRVGYKAWRMAVLTGQVSRSSFEALLPSGTSLYHATEHLLLPVRRIPTVLTVHDLIYKLFPQHHKRLNYWYLNAAMPLFVKRADHIIAVSQATKADLTTHYRVPEEKISVIYEAPAPHFQPASGMQIEQARQKYNLPHVYLAALGTIEPRKNLGRLAAALAAARRSYPDLCLAVIGSRGWLTESFDQALERFNLGDAVQQTGYIPDDDLAAVLGGAQAVVMPSLYEGFGLPILEAMACGVPVLCSRTSSLGEIAGEAALTFDPLSVEEITAAITRLLGDADLQAQLRQRGLAHAAAFSWQKAAAQTWQVYQRLL